MSTSLKNSLNKANKLGFKTTLKPSDLTVNQKYHIRGFKCLGKEYNNKVIAMLTERDFFLPGRFSHVVPGIAKNEKVSVKELHTDDMIMKYLGQDPKTNIISLQFKLKK